MLTRTPWPAIVVVLVALLVPIVPFAIFGEQSEAWIRQTLLAGDQRASGWHFGVVALVLASDILLPVPSSAVLTFAGAKLGLLAGTLAGWIGLNASCLLGYWLGSRFGLPLVRRLSSEQQLQQARDRLDRHGSWMLLGSRVLPVIAEACVLVAGVYHMQFRVFVTAIALANLVVAAAFCTLGSRAAADGWLLQASLVSIALPLALAFLIGALKRRRRDV